MTRHGKEAGYWMDYITYVRCVVVYLVVELLSAYAYHHRLQGNKLIIAI